LSILLVVIVIRIGLWVLPFLRLQRFIRSLRHLPFAVPADAPVGRLVWAVRAAGRRVPAASCLTQSLALQFLLARAGQPSQLRFGINKDPNTGFHAHAWVEWAGTTLLTTPSETELYVPLFAAGENRA
jgi:Transglutaminase-like superfamily